MANCSDYISADDLKTGKQAVQHIEHVAKSKDTNGAHALTVTDTIRGEQVTNLTLDGMEAQFQTAQNERETEFEASQADKEARFQQFLLNSGYQFLGDYENGPYTITELNQVIRYQGELWRLNASTTPPYTTTGINSTSWAVDVTHLVSVGDAALRQELSGKTTGKGDSLVAHAFNTTNGDSITVGTYLTNFESLRSFYKTSDNGDWGPAVTRASAYSSTNGIAIRVDGLFQIKTQPSYSSNCTFIGLGRFTGFYCADDAPIVLAYANGKSNITIRDMSFNGGMTSATTVKNSTRGLRFINCTNIDLIRVWGTRFADWGFSFETCDGVRAYHGTVFGGGLGLPGGRDGLHFLNCRNVDVFDWDVESGDDCVASTTEGGFDSYNLRFRAIRGKSDIASLITIGFESDLSGTQDNVKINDVYPKTPGSVRYVVQCRGATANSIKSVTISQVFGKSNLYGMYLQNIKRAVLNDITVDSITQHGIYATTCDSIRGTDVIANTVATGFDGMQFASCNRVSLTRPAANNAPTFNAQFNACGVVSIDDANFVDAGTAAARFVNCTRVTFHGDALNTVGAYGISQAGNTYIKEKPGSRISGVTSAYNSIPNNGVTDDAYAYGDISQDSATTISSASVYTTDRMTVTASATGQIDVVFTRQMRTNRYGVKVQPYGSSPVRHRVGPKSQTGFSIFFDNFSGTAINASFYLEINNSGGASV